MTGIGPAPNIGPIPAGGTSVQNPGSFVIPIRYGPPGNYTPQYIQIASSQGVQQLGPFYVSTGGHIQGSPGGGITLQQLQGLTGLSPASGAIHQVPGAQLQQRPTMVPVTRTMKVDYGLNDQ
jgi:hypothetical protein